MFYCSNVSVIGKIDDLECVVSESSYRPTKDSMFLRLIVRDEPPKYPSIWLHDKSIDIGSSLSVFITKNSKFGIWCDEEKRYMTISEIADKGYVFYKGKYISFYPYKWSSFDNWKEVRGEFEFFSSASKEGVIRIKAE